MPLNERTPEASMYDVFLCYSNEEKPRVHELAKELVDRGLRVFLDEWELVPGRTWQEALERAISTVRAAAVVYGPSGMGPWANREMRALLEEVLRRDVAVIPVLLPGVSSEPELPVFLRSFSWVDLREGFTPRGIERLVWGITGNRPSNLMEQRPTPELFKLWNVPPLPIEFQSRREIDPLKAALVSMDTRPLAVLGQHARFALQGMGGIGKTVVATALARSPEIRRAFPDGVFWLTVGQHPEEPLLVQARLAMAVGGAQVSFRSVEDGKATLRELFAIQACLLVLDDVWDTDHVEPFNVLGERSKLLVTTRKEEVGRGLGAEPRSIGELPDIEALELLARYSGRARSELPPEAPALVRECGELPLAIAMAGSMLRGRPADRWPTLLSRLRSADLTSLKAQLPHYPHDSLLAAIEVSVQELTPAVRARYLDLAVFPADTPIPEAVLRTFWAADGLSEFDVQKVVDTLVDRSLVRYDSKGRLALHDLQFDYLRARVGDLKPLQVRLVAAYRWQSPQGLHGVADDGYFFQHIARHMFAGEGRAALRGLLFDVQWLAAKLAATETNAILADFQHLDLRADEPARALHDALRLSSRVLDRHPEEMAGQLNGRLLGEGVPELRALANNARTHAARPGLIPLWQRLVPPGGPLVSTFDGHEGGIKAIAISPDGRHAISGADDKTLKLWEIATCKLVRSFQGHAGCVKAVAISPDGLHALSGSDDQTVRVWELATAALVRIFRGHEGAVRAVVPSPDCKHLLSGSDDKSLKLWELETGQLVHSFQGHQGSVRALALSPDGKYAISGSDDELLKVWEVATGTLVGSHGGYEGGVRAIALAPDGKHALAGSHRGALRLWELASGKVVRAFQSQHWGLAAAAISPNGAHALAAFRDNTLELWDLASAQLVRSFEGHQDEISAVAMSPDGRHALSGSDDRTLRLWELTSERLLRSPKEHQGWVNAVVMSPDGRYALSGSQDKTLKLWMLSTGQVVRSFQRRQDGLDGMATNPDGQHARSGFREKLIELWELATGKLVRSYEGHKGWVKAVAISPDGRYALSGSSDRTLKLWRLARGELVRSFEGHQGWVMAVAISPDGRYAVSGSDDNTIKLWELGTGKPVRSFKGHQGAVRAVGITPDGRYMLSGSDDHTLKLWDLATGQLACSMKGHGGAIRAVSIGPDGQHVLSASDDHTLKLWELATGRLVLTLEGHQSGVKAVGISPDGEHALSGSDDNTLKFWALSSTHELASFTGESAFLAVSWGPDGRRAIVGDAGGRVHLLEALLATTAHR